MKTLFARIREHALNHPDAVAIDSCEQTLSYSELQQDINQLAHQLRELGVQTLGIYLDNSPEWIVVDLACSLSGITVVPLPWFFSSEQLQHVCADAAVDCIVANNLNISGIVGTGFPVALYRQSALYPLSRKPDTSSSKNTAGKVSYTSGTTGNPKGILLGDAFIDHTTESIAKVIGYLDIDKHLSVLPYATLLENIAGVYVPLMLGKTIYAESANRIGLSSSLQLNPTALAQTLNRIRPGSLILTPQLLNVLCILTERQQIDISNLGFVAVGGARVTESLLRRARQHKIPAYEGYGLTEFASVALLNTPQHDRIGSAGKALPGVSVRIADDGEICLRTAINNDSDNKEIIELKTGDLGHIDEEGFVYIQGRKKNILVLSTGRNVSPEWVEAELNNSLLIHQSYVFGEGQPELSALIVCADDIGDLSIQTEIDRINQQLPAYARISHWHRVSQAFSTADQTLTPNGRLKRDNIHLKLPTILADATMHSIGHTTQFIETTTC